MISRSFFLSSLFLPAVIYGEWILCLHIMYIYYLTMHVLCLYL